ncbi:aminopeptidase P N-terminal domain-containing protein [Belliella kenyensis]|uniref:Xaa-Pro aminopeptidase n=1 Tax=Belliella kenyensis TaxID=1472724 RepID=A0ABV8EHP7_9BACT|nr:aminopeptidase P N-terminal domain-containing protein [Belliella kenyensis]MCH7402681.1 aminopeptidase P N-terminal domain-containing protein [Belliella kenyensis]MDN3603771.1 aminopeptidase P N-terminal domain-containing protein [Belliella kenyensis]
MKRKSLQVLLVAIISIFEIASVQAQTWFDDGLSPEFHKGRRDLFREKLPENAVAVFFTNPTRNRSNDTEFDFRPNSDFYYLTGFREPNAALIIFKTPQNIDGEVVSEMIFVQPRDPRTEQWDGERLGIEGVKEKLKLNHVYLNSDFLKSPEVDFSQFSQTLAFNTPEIEGGRHNAILKSMVDSFKAVNPSPARPADQILNQIMHQMRGVKTAEEIEMIKKAVEISGKGHIEAFKSIQPGVSERAIQGVHEFVHKALGAEYVGYGSIAGAGNNSTILHYVYNSVRDLQEGVILMDIGAEYRGYSGDITRTVPIKGKFSPEEKAIYEIVLKALEESTKASKPGTDFRAIGQISKEIVDEGLAKLGIIKKGENHSYLPHGISHHLGLDVHDRGGYGPLEPGMIFTIEPGIYIPEGSDCDPKWWGIGIRIEDNILITENGYENLSEFVPRTVADIEKVMKEEGVLQKLMKSME